MSRSSESSPQEIDRNLQQTIEKQLSSHSSRILFDTMSTPSSTSTAPLPRVLVEGNDFLIGINPVVRSADVVNFHMDFNSIKELENDHTGKFAFKCFRGIKSASRPLPFMVLSQQEPGAKLFWRFGEPVKSINLKLVTLQSFSKDFLIRTVQTVKETYGSRYIPNTHEVGLGLPGKEIRRIISTYGLPLGLTFSETFDELDPMVDSLKKMLPGREILLGHVNRFFAKFYPIFPILDEASLYALIDRIIKYSVSGQFVEAIYISSRDDLAVLSSILLILRLSYLSLFSNIVGINEMKFRSQTIAQPADPLILTPISLSIVDLASTLLKEGRNRRKELFVVLQASILMCIYRMVSLDSEMASYNIETDCNCGLMVPMAIALCLDRDPDNYWDSSLDERARNLRRKVWHFLVQLDYTMALLFFCPRSIGPNLYDTKLPKYTKQNSNISNEKLEEEVVNQITFSFTLKSAGSDLLDICLDLKNSYRALEIISKLTDFEIYVQEHLGSIADYFKPPKEGVSPAITLGKLQILISLKLFMATLYYFFHLYYKYKGNSDLDFFFFRKLILIISAEMNYFSSELMFDYERYFDTSFTVLLTPVILIYLHIVAMVGLGLAIRLNCTAIVLEISGNTPSDVLSSLTNLLARNETFVLRKLKLVKLLSERYFFAWKCSKSNSYGCNMIHQKELYNTNIEALKRAAVSWTESQQQELMNIIPDDVPPELFNAGDVREFCYFSNRSIDDSDLRGIDLVKTVQTDNLWIHFNTLIDRDTYAVMRKEEPIPCYSVGTQREPTPTGVNADLPNIATLPVEQLSDHLNPNSNDVLDFNLFSTDWTIEDFFPLHTNDLKYD